MRAKLLRRPGRHAAMPVFALGAAVALAACSTISSVNETVGSTASQVRDTAGSAASSVGNSIRSASDSMNEKLVPMENKVGDALADSLPAGVGGLPAGLPPRDSAAPGFLAVHDMPPQRELKRMTIEERKKLEADLRALRDHQEKRNPKSQPQAAAPPVALAAPAKKPSPAKPPTDQPHGRQAADPSQSADAQPGR